MYTNFPHRPLNYASDTFSLFSPEIGNPILDGFESAWSSGATPTYLPPVIRFVPRSLIATVSLMDRASVIDGWIPGMQGPLR
jgi:hypothetical protein